MINVGLWMHAQSCPTLCNGMDRSPPGSSVHGIFQARILHCRQILPHWATREAWMWPRIRAKLDLFSSGSWHTTDILGETASGFLALSRARTHSSPRLPPPIYNFVPLPTSQVHLLTTTWKCHAHFWVWSFYFDILPTWNALLHCFCVSLAFLPRLSLKCSNYSIVLIHE